MASLTIVGLGPGRLSDLTRDAEVILQGADEVWLRTRRHPLFAWLRERRRVHTFDHIYARAASVEHVYPRIVERIVTLAKRRRGVIYAVPGHPLVGERTVRLAIGRARTLGIATQLISGVSFIDHVLALTGLDALEWETQIIDGHRLGEQIGSDGRHDVFGDRASYVDPTRLVIVGQVDSQRILSGVKLVLLRAYPSTHIVHVVDGESATPMPLVEIDRRRTDHLVSLAITPISRLDARRDIETLRHVVARLRAPDGCPWDREQTPTSLRRALIEEAYEAVDAIDRGAATDNWDDLAEELGDLLMNVFLQVQIADESARFDLGEVIEGIVTKLIRRHPHVFGDLELKTADAVLANWDRIKLAEKRDDVEASRLGRVPASLPALARAQTLHRRASRTGFRWHSIEDVWQKLAEEIGELRHAEPEDRLDELGDVLFVGVILANWLGLDAEDALRQSGSKFESRFRAMERLLARDNVDPATLATPEWLAYWTRAKAE
ncbi:MAG: nucleoside triphosphate pyrophosphohydrolase [Chloroflexota bacterium]|nr:MAG: nucleoside triphosphate pyrophosphohydrolase [Chloroflexota bacterium]